ncbi:PKD domain-containing protein [Thermosediminibacter oceani]|uniref:PKD domain containing protein n=1 Tax=Thermosediminibacter oceani (strain ATCC BAA-1034 / DSM 16646 / JW/IW-1228P) TaxID=555079 RepID=D9S1E1_THEOJ|nr:PKD domain-containing protein [Thermosediminibacter oceani]ADL07218.1 PKD domain containing protein [Thermosediminibacter oceani DSM 16646]
MPKKAIATILIVILLVGIFPPSFVYQSKVYGATISDPKDINPPAGAQLKVGNSTDWYSAGFWKIYVDGELTGDDLCVVDDLKLSRTGNLWNMLHKNTINAWLDAFTPVPSPTGYYSGATFSKKLGSYDPYYIKTITYGGKSSQRLHIREAGKIAGVASITYDENKKEVYVQTTQFPTGGISFPSGVKEGDNITFQLRGTAYANIDTKKISYEFYIDGKKAASNTLSKTTFNDSVTKTLTAGTHSLVLKVTDGVGRTTTYTKSITVQPGSPPPPPPGNINADLKMTLNPPKLKTGTTGDINVSLDASGCTSTGSGPFAYRWWVKLNGTYITPSDGVNPGDGSPYFSIVAKKAKPGDVIWAKVKVHDYSLNKSSEAETQRTVLEEGVEPPEEPEPEPDPGPTNTPPVARFSMPSKTGQGTTVNVTNRSYDLDGEIVDVEWDVSPSSGVDENLGFDGGTITFDRTGTYDVTLTVWDDFGDSDSTTKTIEVTNEPPEAVISAPVEVIQGDDVVIRSNSYDPDGEISTHRWSILPSEGVMGTLDGEKSTIWFDKTGEYTISLTVEDEFGLEDTTQKTITVKPAIPVAYFDYSGTLKENRKIVLDASGSRTSERYPMVWEATEWQIIPPAGGSESDIKIVSSPDMKTRTVLFKKAGDYTVRVRVKNSAGHYSEWYEKVLTIYPDLPPIADFYVYKTVLRNPDDENYASIQLFDISYSSDGDTINSRIWRYKYDSDNDGSFDDESWVVLDDGNNLSPILKTKNVGKYLFELSVKEGFGEETIPEFISPSDYRTADTSDKPINDKVCELINLRPVVDFEVLKKVKADVVFTIGQAGQKTQDLDSKINQYIKPKLAAKNIDAQISSIQTRIIDSKTNFTWEKYDHGKGKVIGNDIYFYGYTQRGYSDFWYSDDQTPGKKTFTFVLNENQVYYHSFYGGGFIFGAKKYTDGTFEGYVLLFDQSTASIKRIPRVSMSQYSNTDGDFGYVHLIGVPKQKGVHNIKVEIDGIKVKVWDNNNLIIDYTLPQKIGEGFGIVADHNSHDCDETSTFIFGNLVMNFENGKSLDEALKTTTWRDNSIRFLVNISDIELPELNDPIKLGDILSRTLSADAYFVGLGTDTNRAQYQTFIARNDGKGTFFYNTNMDTALNQTADYIISVIESIPKLLEQYVLLGEEVTYNTYYSDPETDPKYQERWIYQHDPNYFENSLGLAPFSGQYLSGPVTVFDKVGKYEVQFQARDNPKADNRFDNYRLWSYMPLNKLVLYVHRKPVASFTANLTPVGTASQTIIEDFEDTNYEFSFSGNWGRSTAQRYAGQYSYKSASISHSSTTSTQFTFTIPSGATNAKISFYYLVRSEANYDFFNFYINGNRLIHDSGYGSWKYFSYPLSPGTYTFKFEYTKDGSVNRYDDAAYVDNITVQHDGVITSYNVQLSSTSYDLDHQSEPGKGITQEEWKWKEVTATSWNSGKPSTLGVNKTYIVWLRVKDKEEAWSDPYVSVLSTMQVNLAPIAMFTVDPNTQVVNKTISISDMSYDPNGDPIAEWSWRVQKPDGTWINYGSTPPTNIPSLGVGTYTIELKVRDNPQFGTTLWSEPYTQQVTVIADNNKPVARFTISPNPVVADEPYTISDTSYDPDGDPIVAREWKVQKPDGTWVTINQWKPTFGDDGTYKIQLRVLDDPSRRHPALTPMWSDPYVVTVQVQGRLIVIGDSNKTTYKAGEAMILYARTEGKAYRVEARMWYPKNEFSSSNVTTLVPDTPLTSPPQDVMTWHTKHTKAEGRDVVVIIPKNMPDGNYQVVFTAYKQLAGGGTKTATDTITVRVKGTIYDHSKSQIIGPRF